MRYGSVCSGIEAASVAWHPLGWECAFVSEIDRHASAILRHRFPTVPNYGDFTTIQHTDANRIRLLVGGTPCQSFSVAGLRKGLADDRGNLALEFLRLADRLQPAWVLWENVPGVLSSNGGRDFGSFLGGLGELGYGFAYRVLDAQFFGVPQRRRRVFVVGRLGDWRRAAAVLFEPESLQGHPPPSRQEGTGVAGFTESGFSRWREGCRTLRAEGGSRGGGSETLITDGDVAPPLPASLSQGVGHNKDSFIVAQIELQNQGSGGNRGFAQPDEPAFTLNTGGPQGIALRSAVYAVDMNGGKGQAHVSTECRTTLGASCEPHAVAFYTNDGQPKHSREVCHTLRPGTYAEHATGISVPLAARDYKDPILTFQTKDDGGQVDADLAPTLLNQSTSVGVAHGRMAVRRLTPVECERLQGFEDDWTRWGNYADGKGPVEVSDTQRYKMCGNSMAVPVMRWLGKRIQLVDTL